MDKLINETQASCTVSGFLLASFNVTHTHTDQHTHKPTHARAHVHTHPHRMSTKLPLYRINVEASLAVQGALVKMLGLGSAAFVLKACSTPQTLDQSARTPRRDTPGFPAVERLQQSQNAT